MTRRLNEQDFMVTDFTQSKVTCHTCHRGSAEPLTAAPATPTVKDAAQAYALGETHVLFNPVHQGPLLAALGDLLERGDVLTAGFLQKLQLQPAILPKC